jgi:starvation-inducible outer membrane lipoprotein
MKMKTLALVVALALLGGAGCVVVPQNRRKYLADPMMRFQTDALEAHAHQKLYSTREAAAGGDGEPAGGGCACQ